MPVNIKKALHMIFLLAGVAVILHGVAFYVFVDGRVHFGTLRYFTILSNILVAASFLQRLIMYNSKNALRHYLSVSAMVAITVTGLVYSFVLVPLTGAGHVFTYYANFVTHFLAMVLALANYFIFEEKGALGYRHLLAGVVFPALYWVVFVSLGGMMDFYPYFFMNPAEIGWGMTVVWFIILLAIFGLLGWLLVLFDRRRRRKSE